MIFIWWYLSLHFGDFTVILALHFCDFTLILVTGVSGTPLLWCHYGDIFLRLSDVGKNQIFIYRIFGAVIMLLFS